MQTKQKAILSKFIFLFTIAVLSCKPQLNEIKPVIIQQNNDLTVKEAKEWFLNNEKVLNSNTEKSIGKVVYWNEAKEIKFPNNKNYVLVNANYTDSDNRISSIINEEDGSDNWKKEDKEIKKNRKGYSTILKLLVYKNEAGELEKKLLRVIPTEAYRNKSKNKEVYIKDFSGYITANDWDTENLIEGESIINGKVNGQLSFVSSKTINGARINNSQGCTVTTIATNTEVPCGSGGGMVPGGPQLKVGSTLACYETQYSSALSCSSDGASGATVSYSNIIVSQAGTGGGGTPADGYIGVETNTNFFNRWNDSLDDKYGVTLGYYQVEFIRNNLEIIPFVDQYLAAPETGRPDLGVVANAIRKAFLSSNFEKELFERYCLSQGNLTISAWRFNDIVSKATTVGLRKFAPQLVDFNGNSTYLSIYNLYNSPEYDYGLGSTGLYFSVNQNNFIGLSDTYDFNPLIGRRDSYAEMATRAIQYFFPNALPYQIKYP